MKALILGLSILLCGSVGYANNTLKHQVIVTQTDVQPLDDVINGDPTHIKHVKKTIKVKSNLGTMERQKNGDILLKGDFDLQ